MIHTATDLEQSSHPVQILDEAGLILGIPQNPISVTDAEARAYEVTENNAVIQYLTNNGLNDMAVDGSIDPVLFSAIPPVGRKWVIARMLIYYSAANRAFRERGFGHLQALTNGIDIMLNGAAILNWKDNVDVTLAMYDTDSKSVYSKSDRSIAGRFTFSRFTRPSGGLTVRPPAGFAIKVRDNLSRLSVFRALIEGVAFDD